MSSYVNRWTIGGSYSSHTPSGYHDTGGLLQFTLVDTSQQRGRAQQDRYESRKPPAPPQEFKGYQRDSIGGSNPPSGHTYDSPSLRCPRCGHPFTSQVDLDRHSLICGAAAPLTGMFTPWSAQQNNPYQQPQPHFGASHDLLGGCYHRTQRHDSNQERRV